MRSFSTSDNRSSYRILCASIIVAALALQGFIPLGYMPAATQKARPTITLCGGHTKEQAPEPAKKNALSTPSICSFSIGSLFTPTAPAIFTARTVFSAFILVPDTGLASPKAIHFGNAAPRAPPIFS